MRAVKNGLAAPYERKWMTRAVGDCRATTHDRKEKEPIGQVGKKGWAVGAPFLRRKSLCTPQIRNG